VENFLAFLSQKSRSEAKDRKGGAESDARDAFVLNKRSGEEYILQWMDTAQHNGSSD